MGDKGMKKIRYYLRIYFRVASQYLKERMQYRADFFCDVIGMIVTNLFGIATFWVVFHNITEVGGFGFDEMLFMYGFALMAMNLIMFLVLWIGAVLICMALIILPIGFVAYYPASYFLGTREGNTILAYLSPFIGAAFFWISCKIWEFFAERYAGTGS